MANNPASNSLGLEFVGNSSWVSNLQDICQTLSWPSLYTQTLVPVIRVFLLVRLSPLALLDR